MVKLSYFCSLSHQPGYELGRKIPQFPLYIIYYDIYYNVTPLALPKIDLHVKVKWFYFFIYVFFWYQK